MSASDKDNDDYQVGHGKPPKNGQFKKGQSGNLKGRPKGSKNRSTLLTNALDEVISINEGGRSKLITKRTAIYRRLVNNAALGNIRAIELVLEENEKLEKNDLDRFTTDAELERERQMKIIRAMTSEERHQYLDIIQTAQQRVQLGKEANSGNVKSPS